MAKESKKKLTKAEAVIATQLFARTFPELVRLNHGSDLSQAATKTAAAIRAGLIELREAFGSTR